MWTYVGLTGATSKTVANSRSEQMGRSTMAYQTVNPYDNQIVATFDDLTEG
jgi:hypothetical protein